MNTMEITKFVGAICGSLLVFLLLVFFSGEIFSTHSEAQVFVVDIPEAGGAAGGDAPAEVDVAAVLAQGDAEKGAAVFKKCATCHKIDGANAVGPHLNGVINRATGSVEGFAYSEAMKTHGSDWTPENLFTFLASPKAFVPGTKMSFAGLPKPEDRANVIAYLESVSK